MKIITEKIISNYNTRSDLFKAIYKVKDHAILKFPIQTYLKMYLFKFRD